MKQLSKNKGEKNELSSVASFDRSSLKLEQEKIPAEAKNYPYSSIPFNS